MESGATHGSFRQEKTGLLPAHWKVGSRTNQGPRRLYASAPREAGSPSLGPPGGAFLLTCHKATQQSWHSLWNVPLGIQKLIPSLRTKKRHYGGINLRVRHTPILPFGYTARNSSFSYGRGTQQPFLIWAASRGLDFNAQHSLASTASSENCGW